MIMVATSQNMAVVFGNGGLRLTSARGTVSSRRRHSSSKRLHSCRPGTQTIDQETQSKQGHPDFRTRGEAEGGRRMQEMVSTLCPPIVCFARVFAARQNLAEQHVGLLASRPTEC